MLIASFRHLSVSTKLTTKMQWDCPETNSADLNERSMVDSGETPEDRSLSHWFCVRLQHNAQRQRQPRIGQIHATSDGGHVEQQLTLPLPKKLLRWDPVVLPLHQHGYAHLLRNHADMHNKCSGRPHSPSQIISSSHPWRLIAEFVIAVMCTQAIMSWITQPCIPILID